MSILALRECSQNAKLFDMKLESYMRQEQLTLTELANRLGRPVTTVHGWVHGNRRPGWKEVAEIERATAGAVTAADFVPRSAGEAA